MANKPQIKIVSWTARLDAKRRRIIRLDFEVPSLRVAWFVSCYLGKRNIAAAKRECCEVAKDWAFRLGDPQRRITLGLARALGGTNV